MAMSRRRFLTGIGAGVGVLVVGGVVYRAVDQGVFSSAQGPAYEPWDDWRTEPAEGALRLVQSGILAANPHNIQSWLFHVTEDHIDVYTDTGRDLGAMDVFNREMVIGVGCALENMMLTAAAVGYTANLDLEPGTLTLPSGGAERNKLATIQLNPSESPQSSPLYEAIPDRHTDRHNYDITRPIPQSLRDEMVALAETDTDVKLFLYQRGTPAYELLAETTVRATRDIIADEQMSLDNYSWSKQSWQQMQQDRDGVYIDTAGVSPSTRALVKILPATPRGTFDQGWLDGTIATLENSDTLGFVTVSDLYDQPASLRAGRAWQRMHLWATSRGLSMQPINQMPEIVDRDRQLNHDSEVAAIMDDLTGEPPWRPTFVFRMGYPTTDLLPSARRSVHDVLI